MEEISLKNNQITLDRRLDALEYFDESSREFPVTAALAPRLSEKLVPISKVHLILNCLDQGTEGACLAFTGAHFMLAEPNMGSTRLYTAEYARKRLYHPAQLIDVFPGQEPEVSGTSTIAILKIMKQLGLIDSYFWQFNFEQVQLGVSYLGPAMVATNWYSDMMQTTPDGQCRPGGYLVGRHGYLLYGMNMQRRVFLFQNSWGPKGYGIQGKFWMTFDNARKLFANRGEVVFPHKVTGR